MVPGVIGSILLKFEICFVYYSLPHFSCNRGNSIRKSKLGHKAHVSHKTRLNSYCFLYMPIDGSCVGQDGKVILISIKIC